MIQWFRNLCPYRPIREETPGYHEISNEEKWYVIETDDDMHPFIVIKKIRDEILVKFVWYSHEGPRTLSLENREVYQKYITQPLEKYFFIAPSGENGHTEV